MISESLETPETLAENMKTLMIDVKSNFAAQSEQRIEILASKLLIVELEIDCDNAQRAHKAARKDAPSLPDSYANLENASIQSQIALDKQRATLAISESSLSNLKELGKLVTRCLNTLLDDVRKGEGPRDHDTSSSRESDDRENRGSTRANVSVCRALNAAVSK
jgi:hypothetical protein